MARAEFFRGKVLGKLGRDEDSQKSLVAARKVRNRFMEKYPQYLPMESQDELAVFDQMVSI